jgi:hydroxymethylbilane synthase
MTLVRVATRGSALALWQARYVSTLLEKHLGVATELVLLKTAGDRLKDVSLATLGGKGLFVKEIEESLVDGRADVAVHSAKDLPAVLHPDLLLSAFPEGADPRDALVSREPGRRLADLPAGAHIGTGSVRRGAQLRRHRPDLIIEPLRGNVPTRLRKLAEGRLDAVVMACAGLERLGQGARIDERIDSSILLPAVTQGVIAVQARTGTALASDLAALNHPATARRVAAERSFLAHLSGDCNVPLAALACAEGDGLRLRGLVIEPDGSRAVEIEQISTGSPEELGRRVAQAVLTGGGDVILERLRASGPT